MILTRAKRSFREFGTTAESSIAPIDRLLASASVIAMRILSSASALRVVTARNLIGGLELDWRKNKRPTKLLF